MSRRKTPPELRTPRNPKPPNPGREACRNLDALLEKLGRPRLFWYGDLGQFEKRNFLDREGNYDEEKARHVGGE